ncbi:MAG TPA: hypothetical protein DCY07_03655 [Rhodospirillaceae bacterium]|nr:hypothetical protein [Rhodospirillaceae bacterium]
MANKVISKTACLLALALLLSVASLLPTHAQTQTKEELARIEQELAAQKAAAQSLEKKEKATEEEIEALRDKLIAASENLQDKGNQQEDLETRLVALEKETVLRDTALKESRKRLALLTRLLIQFSRQPAEVFVLREQSPDDHIHRTIVLRSMLPRLREETSTLAKELDNYAQLQNQTESQKRLVTAAQQNLQWQRHNLDEMIKTRQGRLQKTAAEKEALARQLDSLTNEAKDLRQLMEKVSHSSWNRTIGKSTPARKGGAKSPIKMPVAGKIIRNFGDKDDFGIVSDGLTLSAPAGSPVIAPQAGRVMFAGVFRGYGKAIILQHDGGRHSFMSGFSRIDADVGQNVTGGEPLGILPTKGEGKAELYFEWRQGSQPVNPI